MTKPIPRTQDHHDGTGVDISAMGVSDNGYCLCPVCYATIVPEQVVVHLDHHAARNERVDRPRVLV